MGRVLSGLELKVYYFNNLLNSRLYKISRFVRNDSQEY